MKCRLCLFVIFLGLILLGIVGCEKKGNPEVNSEKSEASSVNKGIGPVKSIELGEINPALVSAGKALFENKCSACHKMEEKYVGPPIKGVTKRREPEWIMNMILNPVEMTQKDPIAKELLATHYTQMTFQDISYEQTKALLEYFRHIDASADSDEKQ